MAHNVLSSMPRNPIYYMSDFLGQLRRRDAKYAIYLVKQSREVHLTPWTIAFHTASSTVPLSPRARFYRVGSWRCGGY